VSFWISVHNCHVELSLLHQKTNLPYFADHKTHTFPWKVQQNFSCLFWWKKDVNMTSTKICAVLPFCLISVCELELNMWTIPHPHPHPHPTLPYTPELWCVLLVCVCCMVCKIWSISCWHLVNVLQHPGVQTMCRLIKRMFLEIWGSHSSATEDSSLAVCGSVSLCRQLQDVSKDCSVCV